MRIGFDLPAVAQIVANARIADSTNVSVSLQESFRIGLRFI